jgi:hypothetical protein
VAGGSKGEEIRGRAQAEPSNDRVQQAFWEVCPTLDFRHGFYTVLSLESTCSFSATQQE